MTTFAAVLGEVIAEHRRATGLSQEALAYRAKLHPTYVSVLERGLKSPTVRALAAIAEPLDSTPSSLLKEAEVRAAEQGIPLRSD